MFKEVLEILQHTRLLGLLFSTVFAFMSFLNKNRLGIDISYCFEKKDNLFFVMAKIFNLMYTRCTKTDLELINLVFYFNPYATLYKTLHTSRRKKIV